MYNYFNTVFSTEDTRVLDAFLSAPGSRFDALKFPTVDEGHAHDLIGDHAELSPGDPVCSLAAETASILLAGINSKLPAWPDTDSACRGDAIPGVTNSVTVLPIMLLEINWASSGPGFEWPECYQACPVPGTEVLIVTASSDSTDMYGCRDWALGWFPSALGLVQGSAWVLREWWQHQLQAWEQPAWECVLRSGRISEFLAYSICEECWGEEDRIPEEAP